MFGIPRELPSPLSAVIRRLVAPVSVSVSVSVCVCVLLFVLCVSPVHGATHTTPSSIFQGLTYASDVTLDQAGNVYVVGSTDGRIFKFSSAGSLVSKFSTMSPALNSPSQITIDSSNNIYIADTNNNRIVQFNSAGIQQQIWTAGNTLNKPTGVAVDTSGNLWVIDPLVPRIVKLSTSDTILQTITSFINKPSRIILDSIGNLYFSDIVWAQVVKLDPTGTTLLKTYTTTSPALTFPMGLAIDETSQQLYIADKKYFPSTSRVVKLDATSGSQLAVFTTSNPTLSEASGVALDASKNIYIANSYHHIVAKLSSAGTLLSTFTDTIPAYQPGSITHNSLGNLIIGDINGVGNQILEVSSNTGELVTTLASNLNYPGGVTVDSSDNVFFSNQLSNTVIKLNNQGTVLATITNTPSLNNPKGVAIDPNSGRIYVVDSINNRIAVFNSGGTFISFFTASLSSPNGLCIDSSSNLYIADSNNKRIVKLNNAGVLQRTFTTSSPTLNNPLGVTVDGLGNVYIADSGNHRIVQFNSAGTLQNVYTASPLAMNTPYTVTVSADGSTLYVGDTYNWRILSYNTGFGSVQGDPQFVGFHGQQFQVHGIPDEWFNLVSHTHMQLNALFTYLESGSCTYNNTACWTHPGTYVSDMGFMFPGLTVRVTAGPHARGCQLQINGHRQHQVSRVHDIPINTGESNITIRVVQHKHDQVQIKTPLFTFTITNSDMFFNFETELHAPELLSVGHRIHHMIDSDEHDKSVHQQTGKQRFTTHHHQHESQHDDSSISSYYPDFPLHGLVGQTWRNARYGIDKLPYQGHVEDYWLQDGIWGIECHYNQYKHNTDKQEI